MKNTKKPIQSDEIENNDIEFPIVKDHPEWLKYTIPVKREDISGRISFPGQGTLPSPHSKIILPLID